MTSAWRRCRPFPCRCEEPGPGCALRGRGESLSLCPGTALVFLRTLPTGLMGGMLSTVG